jgi:lysophospholipase L1-like esterase
VNNLKLRIVSASSKTVACLGASLTSGTVSASYIELLEARLPTWRLTNHGVNGDLAWNALQRLDQLIAEQPEYVTILLGTNDVNATLSERNRFHYLEYQRLPIERPSLAWYESNMEEIVRRLQNETRARIALLSLAPIGEDFSHEANRRMAEYNEVIRRLAERHALAYLPLNEKMWAWLEAHADERAELPPPLAYKDGLTNVGNAIALHASGLSWDEISRRNGLLLMTDCLHLNSRGAGLVADLIAGWLEECAPASGET